MTVDQRSAELSMFLLPRRFYADQKGLGVIAVGVVWPSGRCSLERLAGPYAQEHYDRVAYFEAALRRRDGDVVIRWLDEPHEAVYDDGDTQTAGRPARINPTVPRGRPPDDQPA